MIFAGLPGGIPIFVGLAGRFFFSRFAVLPAGKRTKSFES
jgi:hypothetical protein